VETPKETVPGSPAGRVEILARPDDPARQRAALAAGYRFEGRRRDGLTVWSRLATDPPGPAPRLLPDLPDGRLSDGVVELRRLSPADADDVVALRALPEVAATTFGEGRNAAARICVEAESEWLSGRVARLTIRDAKTGGFAGEIGLFQLEPETGQAMVGYDLAPAFRGRGYATRAVRLLAAWTFGSVGMARLIAGTSPENVASQRVLERAGFQREGYQRARLPGPAGTRIDDILYALLP
jgi:RimJ/RimL family protein N-acetyltransferase